MDLFENPLNGNGPYTRPIPTIRRGVRISEFEEAQRTDEVLETGDLGVSILPHNTIEVSMFQHIPQRAFEMYIQHRS